MTLTRLFQPIPLSVNASVRLDEKASHHLSRVLRAAVGEKVVIFNGEGGEYSAVITHIDKKSVEVSLTAFIDRQSESPVNIYLAQGMARGEKMDFIVQKAVELGATGIIPLVTERCNVRLEGEREEKRLQHWRSVAISACEQCGRNRIPEVGAPLLLREWLSEAKADKCFVLSPHVLRKLSSEDEVAAGGSVIILIGPEGGLSDAEVALAMKHEFLPLNLGPRVLRTETAAVAALSVLQFRYGGF